MMRVAGIIGGRVINMLNLLFLLLAFPAPVHSTTVYKCEKIDGSIYYQAKYCLNPSDIQTELICYNGPLDETAKLQIEEKLLQQRKYFIKKQKLKERADIKETKQAKTEEKRKLRAKEKCEQANRQIDEIRQHYRTGYTIKQGVILDRKLNDYQNQRQKYCNYE